MSLADTIVIFGLALILFGPKKLPEIGRQIGKLLAEFRRASNEFKFQLDEELRMHEQAEQKAKAEAASRLTIQPPATGSPIGPSTFNLDPAPAELAASSEISEPSALANGTIPGSEPPPPHYPDLAPPPPDRSIHAGSAPESVDSEASQSEVIESGRG